MILYPPETRGFSGLWLRVFREEVEGAEEVSPSASSGRSATVASSVERSEMKNA